MLGVTQVHNNLTTSQGFGVEFFSTFTLVLIVFGVCDEHRKDIRGSAPLAIGLTVTTAILATVSCYLELSQHETCGKGGREVYRVWCQSRCFG